MSHTDCPTLPVSTGITAAVTDLLATLRKHLANPDPKVSLKAATELTKLLAVLGRNKLLTEPTPATTPPTPPEPFPAAKPVEIFPAERPSAGVVTRDRLDLIPPPSGRKLTSFLGQPTSPPSRSPTRG